MDNWATRQVLNILSFTIKCNVAYLFPEWSSHRPGSHETQMAAICLLSGIHQNLHRAYHANRMWNHWHRSMFSLRIHYSLSFLRSSHVGKPDERAVDTVMFELYWIQDRWYCIGWLVGCKRLQSKPLLCETKFDSRSAVFLVKKKTKVLQRLHQRPSFRLVSFWITRKGESSIICFALSTQYFS